MNWFCVKVSSSTCFLHRWHVCCEHDGPEFCVFMADPGHGPEMYVACTGPSGSAQKLWHSTGFKSPEVMLWFRDEMGLPKKSKGTPALTLTHIFCWNPELNSGLPRLQTGRRGQRYLNLAQQVCVLARSVKVRRNDAAAQAQSIAARAQHELNTSSA